MRARFALEVPLALAMSVPEFAALRRAQPRPMGLASAPAAWPRMLGPHDWDSGLTGLSLIYGYPLGLDQPMLNVDTRFGETGPELVSLEQVLGRASVRDEAVKRAIPVTGSRSSHRPCPGRRPHSPRRPR